MKITGQGINGHYLPFKVSDKVWSWIIKESNGDLTITSNMLMEAMEEAYNTGRKFPLLDAAPKREDSK